MKPASPKALDIYCDLFNERVDAGSVLSGQLGNAYVVRSSISGEATAPDAIERMKEEAKKGLLKYSP
ncbi:hypothetical protein HCZ23_02845 [Celeribacter sp. HF31]|uniref:hypothetical protein n=1 Tax=Celeribacter sp. HF31 TaxID=2721558 RepID=UPI001431BE26|nr:hypothetical protein [Celeribacter sp. HF31]NIY78405.1 hypothetical protein [Celeribacter sp. HF31]